MEMVGTITSAVAAVQERISAAAQRVGRDSSSIRLMAVTKGFPQQVVLDARAAGLSLFGENRVQEAEQKYLDQTAGLELHLIGHLQRNKARTASGLFACVQSIDKVETAEALHARCEERGRTMDILLELNTSGEPTKSGFLSRGELRAGLDAIGTLAHLRVRGLMTVGPLSDDMKRVRSSFAALRSAFEEIRAGGGLPCFDTLSMGMSSDFEIAIEEGATLVRVGTALFGRREQK
jgi:pyridoxal phosphate enzyme (YggS family)